MQTASVRQDVQPGTSRGRVATILLWLSLSTGWLVSIFSVIQEMCMVSACRDTASFTIFGLNMGWFGIAYFSLVLIVLRLRKRFLRLDLLLSALVFSGIGAEFRLLWIQKYIIGGWCPLCVTICCALFAAALLLLIERATGSVPGQGGRKMSVWWLVLVAATFATGLAIAVMGVKALY